MSRFVICLILFLAISCHIPQTAFSETETNKVFKTKYTVIYYVEDRDLEDFIWRIGGEKIKFSVDTALAMNRIDRIVERVKTILDMYPKRFSVNIYLHRGGLTPYEAALYEHKTRSIHISVDNASDGVVAHEIAHAIINQYFSIPPPSKIQEILTQYVDKYLWSDYY